MDDADPLAIRFAAQVAARQLKNIQSFSSLYQELFPAATLRYNPAGSGMAYRGGLQLGTGTCAGLKSAGGNRLTTTGGAASLCGKTSAFRSKASNYLILLARFPERLSLSAQPSGGAARMRVSFTQTLMRGPTLPWQ
jgi:hypothetical protein